MLEEIKKEIIAGCRPEIKESTMMFAPSAQLVYGLNMPMLNEMAKKYKEGGFELVNQLWKEGSFEERMLSARLLIPIAKSDPEKTLKLIKRFGKDIEDWAICDCLGAQSTKRIQKSHQKEIFELSALLVRSKRFWERRLGLVLLVNYSKDKKFHAGIKRIMKVVATDEEYYVKKAVAWLYRNIEKSAQT